MNDDIDLCVPMRETLREAESVLYGWRDHNDDAFDVMVRSGLDVARACSMRSREVVGPQTKVVQNCMLSTQFGVQRETMCVQVRLKMWDVDVGAIGHRSIADRSASRAIERQFSATNNGVRQ